MTSALGVLPALFGMIVLLGVPPLLCAIVCQRRATRRAALGKTSANLRWGAGAAGLALMFNMGVLVPTAAALADGRAQLTWLHWIALTLSWLCFWGWIVASLSRRRRRRIYN
jgi:hypothetical protein